MILKIREPLKGKITNNIAELKACIKAVENGQNIVIKMMKYIFFKKWNTL